MKGNCSTYKPLAGETCLISGPHCDDNDGHVYIEVEVLWIDDVFILYRVSGCWPVLEKLEHIAIKKGTAPQ